MPDARKPLQIKAFRASFTLLAARYIAAADTVQRCHLLLRLGQPPLQSVAPSDDVRLPLRQYLRHQPPDELTVFLVLQLLQHGVLLAHHVAEVQGISLRPRLDGVRQRHLALQLPLRPKMHQDLIFNTSAGVGGEADALVGAERVHRLDQSDGADGDQILLIVRLRVVLFEDAFLKANLPRS